MWGCAAELKLLGIQTLLAERFNKVMTSVGFITDKKGETSEQVIDDVLDSVSFPLLVGGYLWQKKYGRNQCPLPSIPQLELVSDNVQDMVNKLW